MKRLTSLVLYGLQTETLQHHIRNEVLTTGNNPNYYKTYDGG